MDAHDVVVLGAGLAGLACRAGLRGAREVTVLEREATLGGLLQVHRRGDFIFDTTVHVMFFRNKALGARLIEHLPGGVHTFWKRNAVWQQGVEIPYPYQYHLHAIPEPIAQDCLAEFVDNPHADASPESFRAWLLAQFGPGFYRHFFGPYNRKLYGVDPATLDARPMVWTIPADNREAVLRGAQAPVDVTDTASGGVRCFYPRGERGIGAVPDALEALGEGEIRRGSEVVAIDPAAQTVRTRDGRCLRYQDIVSSLPLPSLVERLEGAPAQVRAAARKLAVAPITVVRVGVRGGRDALPHQWTYFPDPELPFYRLVRLETISPELAPPDGASLLLECPGLTPPPREAIVAHLRALGVAVDVEVYEAVPMPFAYVLFTHDHAEAKQTIMRYLRAANVRVVGRYGEWVYGSIETTLVSGLRAARMLGRGHDTTGLIALAEGE